MSWIEDGTLPDFVAGYVNVVTMGQRINQKLLDLAARVTDGGWTALSITNSNYSAGAVTSQWRQIGPRVDVQISLSVANAAGVTVGVSFGSNIFATLPAAARPAQAIPTPCTLSNTAGGRIEAQVGTDGGISIRNTGTATVPQSANFGAYLSYLTG